MACYRTLPDPVMHVAFERLAELMLVGAVSWPAWKLGGNPSFWRAFPSLATRLALALLLYAICAGTIAAFAPISWMRALAIGALTVLAALHWHARPGFGRSRHWAPGSLRLLAPQPWFDRDFFLNQAREHGGVFKTSHFVRPMTCLVGLGDGLAFIKTHDASLVNPPMAFGRFIPGGFLRHMPRDSHTAAKDVFRGMISRDVYEPLEPFMRESFRAEAQRMAVDSATSPEGGVPPRRHVQRAMFAVWTRLFFGVEAGSAEFERLKALYRIIDIRNPSGASDRAVLDAIVGIRAILDARHDTGAAVNGAPATFLDALRRRSPDRIDDPNIVTNLIYLMHTTWADVSGLLVWLLRMMSEQTDWTAKLRQAGQGVNGSASSLSLRFVMETLRLEQSEHLYRVASCPIEHKGVVIPRGWLVRVCVRESHQDPAVFETPSRFNPDRFLARTYTRQQYSPFGSGHTYACLGEGLSLLAGRVFVEELAGGFSWTTLADGPHEYSAWRHWRPSSDWRVRLSPLT